MIGVVDSKRNTPPPPSELSWLVKRDTLNCKPDELQRVLKAQKRERMKLWDRKWRSRLQVVA